MAYLVLPYAGAKIGVAPKSDIWESFMSEDFPNFKLSLLERYLDDLHQAAYGYGFQRSSYK